MNLKKGLKNNLYLNLIVYFPTDHFKKNFPGTQHIPFNKDGKIYIRSSLNYSFKNTCLVTLFCFSYLETLFMTFLCFWNFYAFCINHFLFNPFELFYIHPCTLFVCFHFYLPYILLCYSQFVFLEYLPISFFFGSFSFQFVSKFC